MITDVFCKIVKGELKSEAVYKDEDFWVIKDINPETPVHLLVIPVKHFGSLADFTEQDVSLLGKALLVAEKVAKEQGLHKGYRIIVNEGEHAGKLVPHLHFHILGGKRLGPKLIKQ
jgi:histidine triad (HIT) family protein